MYECVHAVCVSIYKNNVWCRRYRCLCFALHCRRVFVSHLHFGCHLLCNTFKVSIVDTYTNIKINCTIHTYVCVLHCVSNVVVASLPLGGIRWPNRHLPRFHVRQSLLLLLLLLLLLCWVISKMRVDNRQRIITNERLIQCCFLSQYAAFKSQTDSPKMERSKTHKGQRKREYVNYALWNVCRIRNLHGK